MTKTKKPAASRAATPPMVAMNGLASEVFTLAEAAAYLRLSEAEIVDLVRAQNLPGRFTGREWRFLKSAIQQWLTGESPTPQSRKDAQLALGGKYQDDPDLARICDDAYRQRGRPLAKGE